MHGSQTPLYESTYLNLIFNGNNFINNMNIYLGGTDFSTSSSFKCMTKKNFYFEPKLPNFICILYVDFQLVLEHQLITEALLLFMMDLGHQVLLGIPPLWTRLPDNPKSMDTRTRRVSIQIWSMHHKRRVVITPRPTIHFRPIIRHRLPDTTVSWINCDTE